MNRMTIEKYNEKMFDYLKCYMAIAYIADPGRVVFPYIWFYLSLYLPCYFFIIII